MAHTTPSSTFSPSAGDEGRQLVKTTAIATGGNPMYTSTPAHANISIEPGRRFPDTLSAILNVAIHTKASLKTQGLDATLATIQEKLGSAEISAQVEKLTSSESEGDRNEIASQLAAMLKEGDANLTEELKAYDLDLHKVIKIAADTVEKSPEFSRYLRKTSSVASTESDSPARSRQGSQRFSGPRPRSLSSSGKSDFFQARRVEPLAIDFGKHGEQLKAVVAEKEELGRLYQRSRSALAEKKTMELVWEERAAAWEDRKAEWAERKAEWEERKAAWAEEKATWAKTERRLEQYADGYKQDKDGYKQDKEKWEKMYAEAKEEYKEAKEEHKEAKDQWESRYYEAQTEWQDRHAADKAEREKQERRHQMEVRKWENLHGGEVRRREALEEELKALKERLRSSA
ncbi:hypothetical protein PC9H_005537 [Pleurotus ostreatus]|uniref:Uncharacterized protein n=1 Tax=Pleurotus ostreatus TaxID=5322 RepID=A0A8H6ZZQ1_PLEOS|nr:uncharacterized protein PC9H_005537 [Pleurotus ostreatus]KAF7433576.1 hypothetical protein PC9H_005537 [Pleurotus ostreatus]